MSRVFQFFGGRRQMTIWLSGGISAVAHQFLPSEVADSVVKIVLFLGGAFIVGESAADAAGRYRHGDIPPTP